jgi:stage II sporulation protein D
MDGARGLRDALSASARAAVVALATTPAAAAAGPAPPASGSLLVYALRDGLFEAPPGAPLEAVPVGSLVKPFVVHAWARAHPGQTPPVARCDGARCWLPSGHGVLGLVRATAISCNAYFRALAGDMPEDVLAESLRAAAFRVPDPLTPDGAIGLATPGGLVSAAPRDVLAAYVGLVREPWPRDDGVRRQLVAGLRDSAHDGTAAGLAAAGFFAKTGTVPALDGRALSTSGWVVAVDASARAYLGLLPHGTGRAAARALAARLGGRAAGGQPEATAARASAPSRADGRVRVLLFRAFAPRRVLARNAGPAPVSATRGFVGAGGSIELRAGDRLAEGDWELSLPGTGLRRTLRGSLRVDAAPRDTLRVQADVATPEYVAGVLAAELPRGLEDLRVALGAAVLRFLARGPRHGDADVCDLTHCAWFIGRGPPAAWPVPGRAVLLEGPGDTASPTLDAPTWARVLAAAQEPGPDRWTAHCGGEPLSAARVWGGDDRRVFPCPRHRGADRAEWSRRWSQGEVDQAFSAHVLDVRVEDDSGGTWRLTVATTTERRSLSWDEAHARLATVLGWDALPSPADRVVREDGGFRASGRGRGHRVGLCLGVSRGGALLD